MLLELWIFILQKKIKKLGIIKIVLTVIFYWAVSVGLIAWSWSGTSGKPVAIITVNGKEVYRSFLDRNYEFKLEEAVDSSTVFEIRHGAIRISHNDCPHQICTRTGWISRPGRVIACVPKRILIRIESQNTRQTIEVISG